VTDATGALAERILQHGAEHGVPVSDVRVTREKHAGIEHLSYTRVRCEIGENRQPVDMQGLYPDQVADRVCGEIDYAAGQRRAREHARKQRTVEDERIRAICREELAKLIREELARR